MTEQLHHFKNAFIAHNSKHDFTGLAKLADNLIFCSTGYEQEDTLASVVEEAVKDFNPRTDILVPVGNVNSNLLLGAIAARKSLDANISADHWGKDLSLLPSSFFVAVYRDGQYHVREIKLGAPHE